LEKKGLKIEGYLNNVNKEKEDVESLVRKLEKRIREME